MTTLPPGSVIGSVPTLWLHEGWRLARSAPGALKDPAGLSALAAEWHDAVVPGTVAAAIHRDIDLPGDYDADDWWYQLSFALPSGAARHYLRFEGLATLAEVWLNGTQILTSRNMFAMHRVDVTGLLRERNELVIRFRSLAEAMKPRRARPKWKTRLVENQNLRWFRTTLLGRIPGWTPAIAPVGPWAPIGLESVERVEIESLNLVTTANKLRLRARVAALDGNAIEGARVRIGDDAHELTVASGEVHGEAEVDVPLWWPHTHGTPHLESCQLELMIGGDWTVVDCGRVGFRDIRLDTTDGRVRFVVNGVPVFCRGACWTSMDILRLRGDAAELRRALETLRDAGANMVRIGGTMTYESEDFYRLCDELGILVWQDFMFANMDYPVGDADFRREIESEARQVLARLHRHPCIAAYCGGSEVAQQAAMMGLASKHWSNDFFLETLPALCNEHTPGVAYFPSSPWGGALPFHVSTGIAHYYGIGAYRRPLADVKSARVKFATECLGFSNVPEPATMALVMDGALPPPHHPRWKARVPRDSGSGYDFDDVRDHYLEQLFGENAAQLRAQDVARYFAVSRVVTGEVMSRAYGEWRAQPDACGGALVWFHRDLWPGAGWGITDSTGRPKAAWHYLKRAWAPQSIHLIDDGLDGYRIQAINERASPLEAIVEVEMYQAGKPVAAAQSNVTLAARGCLSIQVDALLGYFSDATNAYRFGPPKYDVVAARLMRADTGEVVAEDFHFPTGMDLPPQRDVNVEIRASRRDDGAVEVTLRSDAFLQAVHVECDGFTPSDNYFHLAPGREKRLVFRGGGDFRASFEALNASDPCSTRC